MTTTEQTALQLAARKLVEAQEKTAKNEMALLRGTLNALGQALEAAGATYQPEDKPASDPHGLEALRKIEESREETHILLKVLEIALMNAEQLDKKRGDWVGDMAHTDLGETPGTGYSEPVQALILKLQGELGVEGGRE